MSIASPITANPRDRARIARQHVAGVADVRARGGAGCHPFQHVASTASSIAGRRGDRGALGVRDRERTPNFTAIIIIAEVLVADQPVPPR
jgi:hypothetical protein